jgi:hypothetical protein
MSSNFGQLCRWGAVALMVGGLISVTGCNTHPVEFTSANTDYGVSVDYSPANAESVDILWVIDNSGSMCEEQRDLAVNFDRFLTAFANENIDFQMGVTTTHQRPDGLPEGSFKSKYGILQSTPNPIPTTFGACGQASTVENALQRAVACTTNPSEYRTTLTSGEAACLNDSASGECETYCTNNLSEEWCEDNNGNINFKARPLKEALFPPGNAYRDLPLILRRSDYENADRSLRVDELRDDFGCMSFVGTSGWSFEKGLGAAQKAVDSELVGTFYDPEAEPPADKPNYGLIRKDSSFAVIFVTDENDCTYNNNRGMDNPDVTVSPELMIDELDTGDCGDDVCEFANSTQVDPNNSPLIPTSEIADTIVAELAEIKGREFTKKEVIVASIHGQPDRYEGASFTRTECENPDDSGYSEVSFTCSSQDLGTAFSGDRYARFLDEFEPGRRFPTVDDPVNGKICEDEFGTSLASIAEIIVGSNRLCITEPVFRCTEDAQCPELGLLEGTGAPAPACEPFAMSGDSYCRNAIQLIMTAPEDAEDAAAALADTGYCYADSIGTPDARSCIVDYGQYTLDVCPANDNGLTVNWQSDTPFQDIGEFTVEVNYAVTPSGPEESEDPQQ